MEGFRRSSIGLIYILGECACKALLALRQLAVMTSVEALDPVALRHRLSTILPLSVALVFYINIRTGYLTYALRIEDARSDIQLQSGYSFSYSYAG